MGAWIWGANRDKLSRRLDAKNEFSPTTRILARGASLAVCLLLVRSQLARFLSVHDLRSAATLPFRAGLAVHDDLIYTAAVCAAFAAAAWAARRSPRAGSVLSAVFTAVAVISLLLALANVPIVRVLGSPLTYQWLYYSDFLRGQDARNAVVDALTVPRLVMALAVVALFFAVSRAAMPALELAGRRLGTRTMLTAAAALLLAYVLIARPFLGRQGWSRDRLANPVVVFTRSLLAAGRSPSLLALRTAVPPDDFEPLPPQTARPGTAPAAERPRNVLVVVLESVAAEYVQPYGAAHPATPGLERLLSRGALFENVYAQAPSTVSSLASILLSLYPSITHREFIRSHPDVSFPSLSSELKRRGYRTGFFSSSDNRFMDIEGFLRHRDFDVVRDYRSFPCGGAVLHGSTPTWPLLDGIDDACTADALVRWIREDAQRPFFAVFWTMMTHYPYFAAVPRTDFGVSDPYFARYLDALHHDDSVIETTVRALEESGLDRSTLLAVVGDHGEAFGRHGRRGHGTDVYEENVHVPLLLVQTGAFHGERYPQLGGLVDLGPTILDRLGIEPPRDWQGRSLWSTHRSGRAYFAAWFSDFRLGYREGDEKVIYDVAADRVELYDLRRDPHEKVDRVREQPGSSARAKERLASWVQYQNRLMQTLLSSDGGKSSSAERRPGS